MPAGIRLLDIALPTLTETVTPSRGEGQGRLSEIGLAQEVSEVVGMMSAFAGGVAVRMLTAEVNGSTIVDRIRIDQGSSSTGGEATVPAVVAKGLAQAGLRRG